MVWYVPNPREMDEAEQDEYDRWAGNAEYADDTDRLTGWVDPTDGNLPDDRWEEPNLPDAPSYHGRFYEGTSTDWLCPVCLAHLATDQALVDHMYNQHPLEDDPDFAYGPHIDEIDHWTLALEPMDPMDWDDVPF